MGWELRGGGWRGGMSSLFKISSKKSKLVRSVRGMSECFGRILVC